MAHGIPPSMLVSYTVAFINKWGQIFTIEKQLKINSKDLTPFKLLSIKGD
jgi:hypothetical protein